MLQDLINKGLKLSKTAIFHRFVGKAGGVLGKPVKLGLLLSNAYGKLIDTKSSQSGYEQVKDIMKTFIRLVKAYANGSYRDVSRKSLLIGVGVLLYLVTPLDLVPDFIPVIGLLDDISLIAWFVDAFQSEIRKFRDWEDVGSFQPTPGTL
ncbi:YkvA family protein [Pontibacter vulgaris]|uniref:YkvA family protein n=1 Tax=Pontibacter vulgaris TaxID=2905679 RepID=UPI001FA71B59|nr:YkvA family protein [Pontibacter vulgaris]